MDSVGFLPALEIEQHHSREHTHAAKCAQRRELFVEHEDADQRRHDRLKRRKDGRLAGLKPGKAEGIEQIRQVARDDAERRAQAEALPRAEHDAERLRRAPDNDRANGGQQTGIKVDGVARVAAVERVAGKDAVERVAEARAEAVENADRGELVLPTDERHQAAAGKRQHKRNELLHRDALMKQDQREDHDDRRRGVQQHGRRGQVHERDGLKIAIREKQQTADASSDKTPDVFEPNAKLLWIAHEQCDGEQQRRNAAAQHDRARGVHTIGRQRAREQAHQAPEAPGRDDGRRIFLHSAPLLSRLSTEYNSSFTDGCQFVKARKFCAAFAFTHLSSRCGCGKINAPSMTARGYSVLLRLGNLPVPK